MCSSGMGFIMRGNGARDSPAGRIAPARAFRYFKCKIKKGLAIGFSLSS